MRKRMLLIALFPLWVGAQISDDFSDGDFTNNPSWTGDRDHFKISSSTAIPEPMRPALQLDAPGAGQSALGVSVHLSGALEWHGWIKLSFNTSAGNYARLCLMSDTADLKGPLNGYFIQVGGADDSAWFCRQDSATIIKLMRLSTVYTGNSTNAVRFKITRQSDGLWTFLADPSGGSLPVEQGEVTDLTWSEGEYFGIFCQYTSSNVTKYYFDDFYAGPMIIDTIPPWLAATTIVNPEEILLTFSEAVDKEGAENVIHYEISPDIGHPYEAVRMLDPEKVYLFFDREMQNGSLYELTINNIHDLAGNISGLITQPIMYYMPQPYDVIITEIMADPSPPVMLPEYEYLELFNRSPYDISLDGWGLQISSTKHTLPAITLKSGEYMLVSSQPAVHILNFFCQVVGLSSFNLPNSGAVIHLTDRDENTICYLQYDISWYNDKAKSDGGWSMEMIHVENPCLGEINWKASGDPLGGTPGKERYYQPVPWPDFAIENICVLNNREIEVTLSESAGISMGGEKNNFLAEPFLFEPIEVTFMPPLNKAVRLIFNEDIIPGQIYTLTINTGFQNCIGTEAAASMEGTFAMSHPAGAFDLIINEILFNPLGDGVDYVEIYNRSGNAISLDDLLLATVKETPPNSPDTQSYALTANCLTLLPGKYMVLTSDPEKVKSQYHTENARAFRKMTSFPSYNNDKGLALLLNKEGEVIDGMTYREEMHLPLLNSYKGVALERISPDRLGDHSDNWHSAAEAVGFGTPGYQNSQFLAGWDNKSAFSVYPEVFSPDGDGRDDQLGISYSFDTPGKMVNILIFSADGYLARTVLNNELCGTSGMSSWDGRLEDRTAAPNGIYVIYLEALGMDGKTDRFKKACVLARRR
ncbi:MAG: lamin tail domain-containing protein [Bacteroidales bacterium]|nr:lamin tail domain-containing protein [Bacteroidales bacterium]